MLLRPASNGPADLGSLHSLTRASPAYHPVGGIGGLPGGVTPTNEGFAPGHPLVKEGRRHYGSKCVCEMPLEIELS